jgi:methyl-accepting chemotaxis protein
VNGQAWVLFLPAVLVTAAATEPLRGLLVGLGASLGITIAGVVSHTMTAAGVGRLVVLLPVFPAVGAAAGALASSARNAVKAEAEHHAALERDVTRLSEVLSEVAGGDLSRVPAVPEGATAASTALAVAFADTLLALRRLVRQVTGVVEQIARNAGDVVRTAEEHTSGVTSQTSAVHQTTSTIEELAATAATIAETAERVSKYAGATLRHVYEGEEAVEASNGAMERIAHDVEELAERARGLGERTRRIGATLSVIDDISRQTGMLALNAAIEAARVGEHGRGFSLVADEVRKLADRAQDATARISEIVDDIVRETDATIGASEEGASAVQVGRRLSEEVVAALARISSMVDRTTAAAREISVATRQQRAASDAVVLAMSQVTASSGRYEAGSTRYAAAAAALDALATSLSDTAGKFNVG